MTLAAFLLPAGKLSPIWSNFSRRHRPPFFDFALQNKEIERILSNEGMYSRANSKKIARKTTINVKWTVSHARTMQWWPCSGRLQEEWVDKVWMLVATIRPTAFNLEGKWPRKGCINSFLSALCRWLLVNWRWLNRLTQWPLTTLGGDVLAPQQFSRRLTDLRTLEQQSIRHKSTTEN